jgi:predicted aldo/keto reductase-like oxidoreductase
VRGGRLAKEPPPAVDALWTTAPRPRGRAEWALQWVWNLPEVSLALSGMNTMEHVRQNVEYAGRSAPGSLSAEELAIVDRVREAYRERLVVDCTGCRYCQPCPNGVDIPRILELFNDASIYDQPRRERFIYNTWVEERADACAECGECEARCPQRLAVAEWLQRAHELLSPNDNEEPWDMLE